MPSHKSRSAGAPPSRPAGPSADRQQQSNAALDEVDPIWLLKAAALVFLAALFCGYLTYCLLFFQGQWQLVLYPDRSRPAPATIAGAAFETIRFAVDESGRPQLTGWWIPAAPAGRFAARTILYLPGAEGSLINAQPDLAALHSLGINVFAFDYRGYGQSAPVHPSERRMIEDTRSAWQYLTTSRMIPGQSIIPFGSEVGAYLAAHLAAAESQIPGVILASPRFNVLETVRQDPRLRLLPVGILFHDRFDVGAAVSSLQTPKLFLLREDQTSATRAKAAADPKFISVLPSLRADDPDRLEQIARFLDLISLGGQSRPAPAGK